MMKTYKYILFDWDGCLAKTLDLWFETAKSLLIKENVFVKDKEIIKGFGDWRFAEKLGVEDNEQFNRKLIDIVSEKMKYVKLYKNAFKCLNSLKEEGKKLAIVTTSLREYLYPALKKHNLISFFDAIITGDDVKNHKPDPEVVYKAIELLNANKDETLIIGDGPKDIMAGKSAGITTVSYYPKENKRFYTPAEMKSFKADYLIQDMNELLNIVSVF